MTLAVAPPIPLAANAASLAAAQNFSTNFRALQALRPFDGDSLLEIPVIGEWIFGRDGSLTLIDDDGRFLDGCSVPLRAAGVRLKAFEPSGTAICFLSPTVAGDVRTILNRLSEEQALIIVQPSRERLRIILACDDFSKEIRSGRLFVGGGENWTEELADIFVAHPGLPTPVQFVKLPTLDGDALDAMVAVSSRVFADALSRRAEYISTKQVQTRCHPRPIKRVGLLAKSRFALWDDAGYALVSALLPGFPAVDVRPLWIDQPLTAGPVAVADFAANCDAVVCADVGRADFPNVVAANVPWATWITGSRVPEFAGAAERDTLLIADESQRSVAHAAGWRDDRVQLATWPGDQVPIDANAPQGWTVIADAVAVDPPESLERFSSHRLLWEAIAAEIEHDPFCIGADVNAYLDARVDRATLDAAQLDRSLFLTGLIWPAYAHGLVRTLARTGVPVQAFGLGWKRAAIDGVTVRGAVTSRDGFQRALSQSRKLLHVWPTQCVHPIDGAGRPVLRPAASAAAYLRAAGAAIAPPKDASPLDLSTVLHGFSH